MDPDKIKKEIEKKLKTKDKRKRPKMNVSGKNVFKLKNLMERTTGKRIKKITRKK